MKRQIDCWSWREWVLRFFVLMVIVYGLLPWAAKAGYGCHEADAYFHGKIDGRNEAYNLTTKLSWKATSDWCKTKGYEYGSFSNGVDGGAYIHCQRGRILNRVESKLFPLIEYEVDSA